MDYRNSIYYNLPNILLKKLQIVQNTTVQIITDIYIHEHITPVLKSLHWLPVKYRNTVHKVALISFKCLTDRATRY